MANDSGLGVTILTWAVLAVAVVLALKVAAWLLGAVLGLVFFILFTVVPLAIVGWLVIRIFRFFRPGDDPRPA